MAVGFIKENKMKKLLWLLILISISQTGLAIALGDTFDNKTFSENNTPTQTIKLINEDKNSKFLIYQITSSNSKINISVNQNTNKIFAIAWNDKFAINFKDRLGNYYSEFQKARKNPKQHLPLRSIAIDDGNLSVSQFGSMITGFHGSARVNNLAPK